MTLTKLYLHFDNSEYLIIYRVSHLQDSFKNEFDLRIGSSSVTTPHIYTCKQSGIDAILHGWLSFHYIKTSHLSRINGKTHPTHLLIKIKTGTKFLKSLSNLLTCVPILSTLHSSVPTKKAAGKIVL